MNFESRLPRAEHDLKVQQKGFALTEMTFAIPLCFIVALGASQFSAQMNSALTSQARQLDDALSTEQMPLFVRHNSNWPSIGPGGISLPYSPHTNSQGLFHKLLKNWLCRRPQAAVHSNLTPPNTLHEAWLLMNLGTTRSRALSLQRAACLVEANSRWGPQSTAAVLLSFNAIPFEIARKQSIIAFCPGTARTGEIARESVATQGLKLHGAALIPREKKASAFVESCL